MRCLCKRAVKLNVIVLYLIYSFFAFVESGANLENKDKFDCHPDPGSYTQIKDDCYKRNCCFQPLPSLSPINTPLCFFPVDYNGYVLEKSWTSGSTISCTAIRQTSSGWPNDALKIRVDIFSESNTRLRIKISNSEKGRYEVPIDLFHSDTKSLNPHYNVSFSKSPFGIKVIRKSDKEVLFDTSIRQAPLIFSDQFIQISTRLPSGILYGLGEHEADFLKNASAGRKQFSFWARDQPPTVGSNLYGTHPYFLSKGNSSNFHGVFLLNSNAMDIDIQPTPALTFRTIGGILDLFIFTGPRPDQVISDFQNLIGRTFLPPYWSLGYHLCRWGYGSDTRMKEIIRRNRELGIPYDVQWNDIEYASKRLDWTYDTKNYKQLPEIVKDLHNYGQKYIIIVDPGISSTQPSGSYEPYDNGIKMDVFVKDDNGKPLIGKVWPGPTAFPDFFHPNATSFWLKSAAKFHKILPFDGLWIDMNEPSNFVDASSSNCPKNNWNFPPYTPGVYGSSLLDKTICPSAKHYGLRHYDVHNLYGWSEMKVTSKVLEKIRARRSLIISRSTFSGSGQYGGHWTGDVSSTWFDMKYTIPTVLNFQMFGIPLVGADICGFNGNTTEELCIRWSQLGAFYPFTRNHNSIENLDQDPAAFSKSAQQKIKFVLQTRYSLLPYLYSLFFRSRSDGQTVANPLILK